MVRINGQKASTADLIRLIDDIRKGKNKITRLAKTHNGTFICTL